ncbi:MAG: ArsB/NhaD family transporter [Nitrososphaeraceae archaeon]|nr:ArsB/NhaD family transporter [Nitrososphaeraceae archaeon]MDW0136335.1 ArsB/NhaD family transporter [Nitrososphaeraceae archaeon]MDW0146206.1 ArsB/NhaD family transporter [Nitrososphaeraceae archaeon]MDW0157344.1 ArsB/NhaD family transporter [Nitrososphaeraceae archaeon]MDW0166621.1 ArsB/NhaD family transporter [Nitrososphaeraceae archaeon]
MKSQTLLLAKNKRLVGLFVLAIVVILFLVIPDLVGIEISLSLRLTSLGLLAVYVLLSFEIVHRTTIAMAGATFVILIGILTGLFDASTSFEFAISSIDFNTIGLLLGMMIIVAILGETGVFEYLGVRMSKASKGNMWRLMVMFCVFTATISMLIDNVTTLLLIVPITISVFKTLKISPIPFILAQVLASNVGGTATLIGDPPNILIGSAANIDFSSFIINMGPTVGISLFASLFILKFQFRKYLEQKPHNIEDLLSQDEKVLIKDRSVLKKSLAVLLGVIFLFVIHGTINIEPSIIALSGAGILMIVAKSRPEHVLRQVDWSTLIFFAGLFIIISGAVKAGAIDLLSTIVLQISGGNPWLLFFMIIWISAIASAFMDNIPFAATMIPLIFAIYNTESVAAVFGSLAINPLWWALSLGVGFGGNGTLIGSSAGIVATGLAEINGHRITFNQFLRVGFPFMIASVAVGSIVLLIDVLLRLNLGV